MSVEILEALKIFGFAGLVAYLVYSIVGVQGLGRWRAAIALFAMLCLVALFIIDRYFSIRVPPPPVNSVFEWKALAQPADWPGRDSACSSGITPQMSIPEQALC